MITHSLQVSDNQLKAARQLNCPCKGSGSIVVFSNGKPVWFDCPACGAERHVTAYGPSEIKMHSMGVGVKAEGFVFKRSEFPENALMAHVMAQAKIFPSVGQARKNGWDKPIEIGSWSVTKKKIQIEVTDE